MAAHPRLSIVVPCFNEEERLGPSLLRLEEYLKSNRKRDYELVLVDDGSRDATFDRMLDFAKGRPWVRTVRLRANRGKGRALAEGVGITLGKRVLISDADFSAPIAELPKLEASLDAGVQVALASRAVKGADIVPQRWYRVLMGKTFNLIVRTLLLRGIKDTQCGFKLLEGDLARAVFAELETDRFAFDVEILLRARKRGAKLVEVPVRWVNAPGSRVSPVKDSLEMFSVVIRLWLAGLNGSQRKQGLRSQ